MKQWQETSQILERVERSNQPLALATVVKIEGSSYRRPGAKLLIDDGGPTLGGVSGGCLEADVREVGLAVLRDGHCRLRHYETGANEDIVWGFGLGCDGTVEILVQPLTRNTRGALSRVRELLDGDRPFAVSTVLSGDAAGRIVLVDPDGVGDDSPARLDLPARLGLEVAARNKEYLVGGQSTQWGDDSARVFTEVYEPPSLLVIFGAGGDAMPLTEFASHIGFRVTLVDHRRAYLQPERFPQATHLVTRRPEEGVQDIAFGPETYAVVMTHSLGDDLEWVGHLLRTDVAYVGLLGPRTRTDRILEKVGGEGTERVFGPVGLDIGADGPEQIALCIVAELLAVRSLRKPRHLRQREGAVDVI